MTVLLPAFQEYNILCRIQSQRRFFGHLFSSNKQFEGDFDLAGVRKPQCRCIKFSIHCSSVKTNLRFKPGQNLWIWLIVKKILILGAFILEMVRFDRRFLGGSWRKAACQRRNVSPPTWKFHRCFIFIRLLISIKKDAAKQDAMNKDATKKDAKKKNCYTQREDSLHRSAKSSLQSLPTSTRCYLHWFCHFDPG